MTDYVVGVFIALGTVMFVVFLGTASDQPEENDHVLECYAGGLTVYRKTSPEEIDYVAITPDHIVLEDEDDLVNIYGATCVVKEAQ